MGYGARSMPEIFVSMYGGLEAAASTNLSGTPLVLTPPNAASRVLIIGGQFTNAGIGTQTVTFASSGRSDLVVPLPQNVPIPMPFPIYRGAPGQNVTVTGSASACFGSLSYCFID